jgi:hypothetical protein
MEILSAGLSGMHSNFAVQFNFRFLITLSWHVHRPMFWCNFRLCLLRIQFYNALFVLRVHLHYNWHYLHDKCKSAVCITSRQ